MSDAAPNDLDLVIDFVNTLDMEEKTDALATAQDAAAWLSERGLLRPMGTRLDEAGRRLAVELREALRSLMLANNGGPGADEAGAVLERVAREGDLAVRFAGDGTTRLAPGEDGLAGALAGLLAPVALARTDGTWQRVKACREPTCVWAFYDRSRNRSGVWCDMAVCGNRTKVKAYRERTPSRQRR